MPRLVYSVALLALTAISGLARAQTGATVDEGSFSITVNGQRAGREDFRIAATPNGAGKDYLATATVVYGERRLRPELHADNSGMPIKYVVETRAANATPETWSGLILRDRVTAKMQNARGESVKEFIVTTGALILDDDVFHQYYFVANRVTSGSITAVVPRRNTQLTIKVASAGAEKVTIGTQDLDANHLVLTESSGAQRDVWVDRQGRVLKVAIPARGVVALRDDPPRGA